MRGCAALRSDLIDPDHRRASRARRQAHRRRSPHRVPQRCRRRALRHRGAERHGRAQRRLPPERRIEFRIGIHLGDVVEESDGDLMGDGVNIAARLEGIAEPGGICLSEDAYRQVRDRIKEAFIDLGEKELKNIARPVRAYAIKIGSAGPAPRHAHPHQTRRVHRASPSSSCPSPISAATRSRSTSSMV